MSASEMPASASRCDLPPVNWGRQIYCSIVAAIALLAVYPAYNHWRIDRYETLRRQISTLGGSAPRHRRTRTADDVYWAALGGNMASVELRRVHFPQSAAPIGEALVGLRGCAEMQQLQVDGQVLDLKMCRAVFGMRRLEELRLCFCQMSDDELRGIERLHRLKTLDLRGTPVTDASLNRLAALRALQELNLQYTSITSAGAARLADELPQTKVLHRSWPSERHRQACQRLLRLGAVVEINEDPALGDCLRLVREQWRGTPRDISQIAHLDIELVELKSLDLEPELLASVAALPNLKSLSIDHCGLRNIDWTPLHRCPLLRNIALKHVVVEPPVVEELAQISRLESLALVNVRLAPGSLASLPCCERLQTLAVVGTRIRKEGLCRLTEVKTLKHLQLSRLPFPESNFERLSQFGHLERLTLNHILIGDHSVPYLSRLARLKQLDIGNTSLTSAGVKRLEVAMPACQVIPGDLRPPFNLVQFFHSGRETQTIGVAGKQPQSGVDP